VGPWWYTVWYLGGALPDGAATAFLFFASLCAQIASSVMMTLLTNSGNDPPPHVERHALLYLGGEANHEAVLLLVIGVPLVWHILYQVVEQLGVVMHGPSTLL
jgi:hypothetical protein